MNKCKRCGAEIDNARDPRITEEGVCIGCDYNVHLLVVDGLSGDKELEWQCAKALREYFELWKKKQHDYGSGNIAANGTAGVVVRINDKMQRLRNLILESSSPSLEAVEDTWLDILGYSIIGLLLHRGHWPKFVPPAIDPHAAEFVEYFRKGVAVKRLEIPACCQDNMTDWQYKAYLEGRDS
jgi:hypothetical protein